MSHIAYRAALSSITAAEADGEEVSARIGHLARRTGILSATIRHEVTEIAEL